MKDHLHQTDRRRFLLAAAAGATTLATGCSSIRLSGQPKDAPTPARPGRRPNILFLLADQWRAQALGCAGDPNVATPNIDRLAARGVRFTSSVTNSPVCTPYRGMLESGRYPARTGVWENNRVLPSEEYCLAEIFRDAGYATGRIGKWHLDGDSGIHAARKRGEGQFQWRSPENNVRDRQGWEYWAGYNRYHRYWDGAYFTNGPDPILIPEGAFEPVVQTDLALNWIGKQQDSDRPWFMTIAWGGPHQPYTAPDEYLDRIDPASLKLRPNFTASEETDERKAREQLQGYYAHILVLDEQVGRLSTLLEEKGMDENTIVVLTSDHGDMHGSQGQFYKKKPWEESILVPHIVRWPEGMTASPGRVSDELFSGIDWLPTLCGLCGVEAPEGLDGRDNAALIRGDARATGADATLMWIGAPDRETSWRGVRTRRHTYAFYPNTGKVWTLYDNETDPYQMNNLADDDGALALRRELHDLTLNLLRKANDPMANMAASMDI